jgi:hypothetical protein
MYMAPEQAKGEVLDHRADLFSLGSVLYAMCTGRPPFRAESMFAVLKRVVEDVPRPIRDVIPEVPQWLCRIVEKFHAKGPADRFQTAQEVADLLADCEQQMKAHEGLRDFSRIPDAKPAPRQPGRRKWTAAALVVLLSLLAWGVYALTRPADALPPGGPGPTAPGADDWVQLFNGADLSGWETHLEQPGQWEVKDGQLTCSGPQSHLFTRRDNFSDVRVRAVMKINLDGDSGVIVRSHYGSWVTGPSGRQPHGYEVNVKGKNESVNGFNTGSIFWVGPLTTVKENPIRADTWFTLEVEMRGYRIRVFIDGKPVSEATDTKQRGDMGRISLQHNGPSTEVYFKSIEIKELRPEKPGPERKKHG